LIFLDNLYIHIYYKKIDFYNLCLYIYFYIILYIMNNKKKKKKIIDDDNNNNIIDDKQPYNNFIKLFSSIIYKYENSIINNVDDYNYPDISDLLTFIKDGKCKPFWNDNVKKISDKLF